MEKHKKARIKLMGDIIQPMETKFNNETFEREK